MGDRQITGIYISSGVSQRTEQGFCMVEVTLTDGSKAVAQMPPEDVRKTALDWLEAAEAAVHDSAAYRLLSNREPDGFSLEPDRAAHFVAMLRASRQDADTMVESPAVIGDQRRGLIDDARTTDQ